MRCRHCAGDVDLSLVDLGSSPPSNAYLEQADLEGSEVWFPLRVKVCESCWLVQTEDFTDADGLFHSDYAYFSGFSTTWVDHCRRFVDAVVGRFGLGEQSRVVEVACNDGTLLQQFRSREMSCVGIEPTARVAAAARSAGLDVREVFLSSEVADELRSSGVAADLLVANNVLAHVPDIVGFLEGCRGLMVDGAVATFEFPHLVELVDGALFDTIYHEHFSYLSLCVVDRVLKRAGLSMFDAERLPTHGGSLRVFASVVGDGERPRTARAERILDDERSRGVETASYYAGFQAATDRMKNDLLAYLVEESRRGRRVVGYGAAAKGNTLLNYAGVRSDLLEYVVDNNPAKQGTFLPGSRIPVVAEEVLIRDRPDRILVLPWNIRDEIVQRLESIGFSSGDILTAVPALVVG